MKLGVMLGCLFACAMPAANAAGHTFGLLIGVSQYPNLDQSLWLEGPHNDVQLMRQLLLTRGVPAADIRLMADGVAGAEPPNRRAILSALGSLASRAQRGDFVFLMIAGHGSQQPSHDDLRNEPDGLDEIFLPRDVGHWDGQVGAVHNAITDNEIGDAIRKIRSRGAFVWAIFDTCHSGTLVRGVAARGERIRGVAPQQLKVPAKVLLAARARAEAAGLFAASDRAVAAPSGIDAGESRTGDGGYVAFYATQSQETTPEALLPLYSADALSRGLFSYTLYQVLAHRMGLTYRQAIELVLQSYQGMGRQSPTPTYEGSNLDYPLLGADGGQRVTQWRVDNDGSSLHVHAGLLDQITRGSLLAIYATPVSRDSDVLGYAKVSWTLAASAEATPIPFAGKPRLSLESMAATGYARPYDLKIDFKLRVSVAPESGICGTTDTRARAAVAALRKSGALAERLQWVPANAMADVHVCQSMEGLRLLDASGELASDARLRPPVLSWPQQPQNAQQSTSDAEFLAGAFAKAGRVSNLMRLMSGVGSVPRLKLSVTLQTSCSRSKAPCQPASLPLSSTSRPIVGEGDKLIVTAVNPLQQPVDLTVLYVDAAYGIAALFPDASHGETARLEPGATLRFPVTINAQTLGFERLLCIGIPVAPQAPSASLESLAQSSIMPVATRGRATVVGLLMDAAFGISGAGSTRSGSRSSAVADDTAELHSFGWNVVAR